MADPKSVGMIFYNSRTRWVAVINLATATAGIYLSMRYVDGGLRWLMVVFLSLFSLFWVRDVFFGFPLKLISDGTKLHWQDGKQAGSAPLKQIRRISIGVAAPRETDMMPLGWTYIRFHLSDGQQHELPPNLASGLRSRNWRLMRNLVAHLRTVSSVSVVPLNDPKRHIEGVKDELFAASLNGGPAGLLGNSGAGGGPPSVS
jgi:hypothetical protein